MRGGEMWWRESLKIERERNKNIKRKRKLVGKYKRVYICVCAYKRTHAKKELATTTTIFYVKFIFDIACFKAP